LGDPVAALTASSRYRPVHRDQLHRDLHSALLQLEVRRQV
jgi:hypothetical protein